FSQVHLVTLPCFVSLLTQPHFYIVRRGNHLCRRGHILVAAPAHLVSLEQELLYPYLAQDVYS
ncbi:MAG: hypothetical protein R3309_08115, partial [Reinekea sp.]|nr:hypothetical protein [Reinekea sp.]